MNRALKISYAVSLVGFLMMMKHLPGSALLLLISIVMQVVTIFATAVRNKEFIMEAAGCLSITMLISYLISRLLFGPFMGLAEIALVAAIVQFVIDYKRGTLTATRNILLVGFLVCSRVLSHTKTSSFYEFKYDDMLMTADELKEGGNEEEFGAETISCKWADYAYFLAIEGNTEEAVKAADTALEVCNRNNCPDLITEPIQELRGLIASGCTEPEELMKALPKW